MTPGTKRPPRGGRRRLELADRGRLEPAAASFQQSLKAISAAIGKTKKLQQRLQKWGFSRNLIFPKGLLDLQLVLADREDLASEGWVVRRYVNPRVYACLLEAHARANHGIDGRTREGAYLVRKSRSAQRAHALVWEDGKSEWRYRCQTHPGQHCYHVDMVRMHKGYTAFRPAPKEEIGHLESVEAEAGPREQRQEETESSQAGSTTPSKDHADEGDDAVDEPLSAEVDEEDELSPAVLLAAAAGLARDEAEDVSRGPRVTFHGLERAVIENCPHAWFLAWCKQTRSPQNVEFVAGSEVLPENVLAKAMVKASKQDPAERDAILALALEQLEPNTSWDALSEARREAYRDAFRKKLPNKSFLQELRKCGATGFERVKNGDDGRRPRYRVL